MLCLVQWNLGIENGSRWTRLRNRGEKTRVQSASEKMRLHEEQQLITDSFAIATDQNSMRSCGGKPAYSKFKELRSDFSGAHCPFRANALSVLNVIANLLVLLRMNSV